MLTCWHHALCWFKVIFFWHIDILALNFQSLSLKPVNFDWFSSPQSDVWFYFSSGCEITGCFFVPLINWTSSFDVLVSTSWKPTTVGLLGSPHGPAGIRWSLVSWSRRAETTSGIAGARSFAPWSTVGLGQRCRYIDTKNPKFNSKFCPWKVTIQPNRKVRIVFQASFFRGHVKLGEGKGIFWYHCQLYLSGVLTIKINAVPRDTLGSLL